MSRTPEEQNERATAWRKILGAYALAIVASIVVICLA